MRFVLGDLLEDPEERDGGVEGARGEGGGGYGGGGCWPVGEEEVGLLLLLLLLLRGGAGCWRLLGLRLRGALLCGLLRSWCWCWWRR